MLTSGIVDVAIGLAFVFGVTAALASVVTELIARLIGLRGAYLLSGLRELVDGGQEANLGNAKTDYEKMKQLMTGATVSSTEPPPEKRPSSMTGAMLGGPILSNQGIAGRFYSRNLTLAPSTRTGHLPKMTPGPQSGRVWSQRRSLPSYVSARSFGEAIIDMVVPNATGQTTMGVIQQQVNAMPDFMSPLKPSLQALVKDAGDDVSRFRTSLEKWYDDHMDRVSGWYKRHVAKITLVFGAVLVVLLNLNALTIGRTLYTQNAVSSAISSVAAKGTDCATPTPTPGVVPLPAPSPQSQQECLENLQAQLSAAATAGLPIGWGTVRDCTEPNAHCNWLEERGIFSRHGNSFWQLVLVLIGFLIMIIAIVPGAQFWFGLLSMIGSLRTTGPKPTTPASTLIDKLASAPARDLCRTAGEKARRPVPKSGFDLA